ncbi:uncharacterized protein CEXT_301671 [Caerostris extrusa]|uniref:Uncharacterized protein n=1 Tax=Caerostris extrusa TaxID=172846 RepID=A0AAV4S4W6_CAEEX|nr:uncharacterized protein CEXT_301671 [Caerostris extrusa]
MEREKNLRPIAKRVVAYVLRKAELIDVMPENTEIVYDSIVTPEYVENFATLTWVKSHSCLHRWKRFIRKHHVPMKISSKIYLEYVGYACYLLKEENRRNAFECMLEIFALIIQFAIFIHARKCSKYLNSIVDVFCAFFYKELYHQFLESGSWRRLRLFLVHNNPLKIAKTSFRSKKDNPQVLRDAACFYYPELDSIARIVIITITRGMVEAHQPAVIFAEEMAARVDEMGEKDIMEQLLSPTAPSRDDSPQIAEAAAAAGPSRSGEAAASPFGSTKHSSLMNGVELLRDMSENLAILSDLIKFLFKEDTEEKREYHEVNWIFLFVFFLHLVKF